MRRQTWILSTLLLSIIVLLIDSTTSAQTQSPNQKALDNVALPKLLPASPEPTAFLRAAFANANMSTGAASAEIPLYTIKLRDFSFPISLSYSTQGLKADEPSTRTGLGWVLNATGMVTRSVKGLPDEFGAMSNGNRWRLPAGSGFPGTWDEVNSTLFLHYRDVTNQPSVIDTEVDEFNFHVNGHKGSFVLDDSWHAKATTATNARISVDLSEGSPIFGITIVTEDGVSYHFGNAAANAYEQTSNTNIAQFNPNKANTRTAFFLDKITLVTGEQINFVYGPDINYTLATGTDQALTVIPTQGMSYAQNSYTDQQTNISYRTHAIQNIQVPDGRTVNFTYSNGDIDKQLTGIDVVDTGTGTTPVHLKTYGFEYQVVSGKPHPRFFLTKVKDTTGPELSHIFEYNDLPNVPEPITKAQDFGGFYNGHSTDPLIPGVVSSDGRIDLSFRTPEPNAAMKGTLSSITYPTGGKQEFFYEANTRTTYKSRTIPDATYNLDGPGGGSAGSYSQIMYYNNNVTVPFDQTVTIECWAEDAMADYPADTQHENVAIWVYEGATLIGSRSSLGLNSVSSTTITLYAGHTYSFQMKANHYTEVCHGRILYKKFQQASIIDTLTTIAPGLRVREIRSTDQFTGATNSKFYTYASLNDLKHSSGTGGDIPSAVSTQHMRIYSENGVQVADFDKTIYSSSTMNQVFSLTGSPVYYNTVIESDDPDFANGGTEYTFYDFDGGSSTALLLGQNVPFVGGNQYPTLTGEVHYKKMFDKNKTVVQLEETKWESNADDSPAAGFPLSYHVRRNFNANGSDINKLNSFDVIQVEYGAMWNRIKYKEVTTYVNGVENKQRTDYSYAPDWTNLLPDTVAITDSRGQKYKTVIQYANTSTVSDVGYSILSSENRLSVPVYKAEYYNQDLKQEERTYYKNAFPTVEDKIQFRATSRDVLHDEIRFISYDSYSHPAYIQKVNDVEFAYLWDPRLHQPIAEVKNASPDNVGFTSFEDGAHGGWSLSQGPSTTLALTGINSFTGTLTKSVAQGTYTVSMWTYGSTNPTVNGVTGNTVRSSNGWNLLKWRITMTSAGIITVNAQSQYVDEVRVHPEGAEMVTYTYFPFIGVASKMDVNQRGTFYEYDSSHRLSVIRDQDNNVIKTFDYHHVQEN